MSGIKISEINNSIHIEIDPIYTLYIKKELIHGIIVDTEHICIHFVSELQLSDFKIPISKDDDFSMLQLEFLRMINKGEDLKE